MLSGSGPAGVCRSRFTRAPQHVKPNKMVMVSYKGQVKSGTQVSDVLLPTISCKIVQFDVRDLYLI